MANNTSNSKTSVCVSASKDACVVADKSAEKTFAVCCECEETTTNWWGHGDEDQCAECNPSCDGVCPANDLCRACRESEEEAVLVALPATEDDELPELEEKYSIKIEKDEGFFVRATGCRVALESFVADMDPEDWVWD